MAEKQSAFGKAQLAKARERASDAEQAWAADAAEASATEDKTARLKAHPLERDRKDPDEATAPKKRAAAKPNIRRGESSY